MFQFLIHDSVFWAIVAIMITIIVAIIGVAFPAKINKDSQKKANAILFPLFLVVLVIMCLYIKSSKPSSTHIDDTTASETTSTIRTTTTITTTTTTTTKELYEPLDLFMEENNYYTQEDGEFWGVLSFNKNETSNDNKSMPHSITWYNNNNDESAALIANYSLDNHYKIVSGVLFLPVDSRDTEYCGYIEAYGDDELIYTSPSITGGFLPKEIEFSVVGITHLQIAFYGDGSGGMMGSGPSFGVSNLRAE